jgi:hypothetical protein
MGFESYLIEFLIERTMNIVKQNPFEGRAALLRGTLPSQKRAACFRSISPTEKITLGWTAR